jgi:nucleoside-diphosphate-sugar epimerase
MRPNLTRTLVESTMGTPPFPSDRESQMELRDKVVLVTGANGFVGSHGARRLLEEGMRVRALVRRPEAQAELERWGVETLLGEFTDPRDQERAVQGAHAVVHCVATDAQEMAEAIRVNAEATRTLAEAALTAGCERFVHISTIAVYTLGGREGVVEEDSPLVTQGDSYAVSKAEAERALGTVAARGLKTVVLRPAAILGAHPTSIWGTKVPKIIASGQFPQVDGGQGTMGYLHISTLADAMVRALRVDAAVGQAFNIADGHTHWGRYLDFFRKSPLPAVPADKAPAFLSFRGSLSLDKAQRVLGLALRGDIFEPSMAEIVRALPA